MNDLMNWFRSLSQPQRLAVSAVITFACFALMFNWKVSLLLMTAIGFHEQCHVWAAQYLKLKTKSFIFIPFLGGISFVLGSHKTRMQQAIVVLGGPVGGGLLALIIAGIYYLTGIPWLAATSYWMFWLNVMNLLPFAFLDGGQLLGCITYSINQTLGVVCFAVSTFIGAIVLAQFN